MSSTNNPLAIADRTHGKNFSLNMCNTVDNRESAYSNNSYTELKILKFQINY